MGARIGIYKIIEPLGVGPSGPALLAMDTLNDRLACLKLFGPAGAVPNEPAWASVLDAINAYSQVDLEILATIYGAARIGTRPAFIARQHIAGISLAGALDHPRPLPLPFAAAIIHAAATAVAALHREGLTHGNLKLNNLFLQNTGDVVVVDPAVHVALVQTASQSSDTRRSESPRLGQVALQAPEAGSDTLQPTPAADRFALGALAYRLLTGRWPRPTPESAIQSPRTHNPDLPPPLDHLIVDSLRPDPSRRIGTATEIADRLHVWLATLGMTPQEARCDGAQALGYLFMRPAPAKSSVALSEWLLQASTDPASEAAERPAPQAAAPPAHRPPPQPSAVAPPPETPSPDWLADAKLVLARAPRLPDIEPIPAAPPPALQESAPSPLRPSARSASPPLPAERQSPRAPSMFLPPDGAIDFPPPLEPRAASGRRISRLGTVAIILALTAGAVMLLTIPESPSPPLAAPPAVTAPKKPTYAPKELLQRAREGAGLSPVEDLSRAHAAAVVFSKDGEVQLLLARALIRNTAYDEAWDALGRAQKALTDNPVPARVLVQMLLDTRKFQEAIDAAKTALKRHGSDAPLFRLLGAAQLEIDPPLAAETLAIATQLAPEDADAWLLLAKSQTALKHPARAATAFRKALELAPQASSAYMGLAAALVAAGRGATAITTLQRGLSHVDHPSALRLVIGRLLLQSGRPADAIPHLEVAAHASPSAWRIWATLGLCRLATRAPTEAVAALETAIAHHGGAAPLHYNLGLALAQSGQSGRALAAFSQALTLQPTLWQAHCERARLNVRLGHFDNAARDFATVRRQAPDVAVAQTLASRSLDSSLAALLATLPCSVPAALGIPQ